MDTYELNKHIVESDWNYLQTLLPEQWQEQAYATGALRRKRAVKDPANLLRMLLAYGFCGLPLRSVAAWAQLTIGVQVSDVALLKRLRKATAWLDFILNALLARRVQRPAWKAAGKTICLVDATCISRPGSIGTDWRIHLSFQLNSWQVAQVQITDASGGESLTRFACSDAQAQDQIVIGDRGYANRPGIWSLARTGASVLVRMNWQNLPVEYPDGTEFELFEHLRSLEHARSGGWAIRTKPDPKAGLPAIAGRLVAIRKSEQASEESRRKLLREARKKGKTPTSATLEAAEYIFVFTTLPEEEFSNEQILELYRFRWQVELAFKRMKSLLYLDEMTAKDEQLCRAFLLCKLIGALLIEDLSSGCSIFSPWGYGMPQAVKPLATSASAGRGPAQVFAGGLFDVGLVKQPHSAT